MNTGTFLGYRNDKGEEMHCTHAKCISPEMCLKGCRYPVAKSAPSMSDLVERLRNYILGENDVDVPARIKEAADEIERLRKQLVRAHVALRAIEWRGHQGKCPLCAGWMRSDSGETPGLHTKDCIVGLALTDDLVKP